MKHTSPLARFVALASVALLLSGSLAQADQVVFDNITKAQQGVTNVIISGTSSTPNTFMGGAFDLASNTTSLTGLDFFPVNFTSTTFTALKVTYWIWGTVNTSGTVSASTPAFSNLLTNGAFTVNTTLPPNNYDNLEGSGGTPFDTFSTPISLTNTRIGFSVNYQGSTDGVNFSSANQLSSVITLGTNNTPTVGTNVFTGYYRNAAGETTGNFTSSLRSIAPSINESIAVRFYTASVPEPSTLPLVGLAGVACVFTILRRNTGTRKSS